MSNQPNKDNGNLVGIFLGIIAFIIAVIIVGVINERNHRHDVKVNGEGLYMITKDKNGVFSIKPATIDDARAFLEEHGQG
jgi:hypothetical protein